jgi:hypothetical protein
VRKTDPRPVLLADRFEVRRAMRHSARSGVYRALDHQSGAEVIVKQARAHVGGRRNGTDSRDGLRNEWTALTTLAGLAPEPIHRFGQDGHALMIESLLPGRTPAAWLEARLAERADGPLSGLDPELVLDMARRLTALLGEVHQRGLVLQDFTPPNMSCRWF